MATILSVQEIPSNHDDVQASLIDGQHKLIAVRSVRAAREILQTQKVDAVICAVHLQADNVFELLKFVKTNEAYRDIAFVFFCSHPTEIAQFVSDTLETTARLLGADGFVANANFDVNSSRAVIESLLPYHSAAEHPPKIVELRNRVNEALAGRRFSEAEPLLKHLLDEMIQHPDEYSLLELASAQHDLAETFDAEGKAVEARRTRESIQDF